MGSSGLETAMYIEDGGNIVSAPTIHHKSYIFLIHLLLSNLQTPIMDWLQELTQIVVTCILILIMKIVISFSEVGPLHQMR